MATEGKSAEVFRCHPEEPLPLPDFRLLFESAPGLYLVLTPGFKIVAVSDAYLRATMTSRDQILGKGLFEVFPDNPDDPGATGVRNLRASLDRALQTRQPDTMAVQKYDIRRPESEGGGFEERYWSPVNSPVIGSHGEVVNIIHRVEDVTEFVRLKQTGREHEQMTEVLKDRAQQMESEIYLRAQQLAEANTKLRKVNGELARLYRQVELLMARADDELTLQGEEEPHPDRPITPEEMLTRVASLIAGRKRLEEELRHAQKMEAIGQLAGGVAHDFNNLLTVIIGYCNLLLAQAKPGDKTHLRLEAILTAGQQAAALTQQLLAFSRKQVLQPVALNLAATLQEMDRVLRRLIGEHIEIETVIDENVGVVKIDPSQMQQVVINLVVNSRDAMPHRGKLTIELQNAELDEFMGHQHNVPPGSYVMFTVSDNGVGIEPEVQQRIFEPFFTTKEVGQGTGLGLATVYGIVKQSGGYIWLYSEPGNGTTFKIFLPRVDEALKPAPAPHTVEIERGSETVLLVEDDPKVRWLVEETLTTAGYQVMPARDGDEAFRIAEQFDGEIHLLLSDVIMPKTGGRQTADNLLSRRPQMKVLLMSGYTGSAMAHQGILDPSVAFIQKPFSPEGLCTKIRTVLGPQRSARRILAVDDNRSIRELLTYILNGAGFETFTAEDGREAREQISRHDVDLAIIDLVMPDEEGIELIQALRKQHPHLKIIAMSGTFGSDILNAARHLGADATLSKPFTQDAILECVQKMW